jgi:DNA-binding CsgD family transcriptional regulator/tetratricopeptide (TPR) repeat protein
MEDGRPGGDVGRRGYSDFSDGVDQDAEQPRALWYIPRRERQSPAGLEDAGELCGGLFGPADVEDQEVAEDCVERSVGKRQSLDVTLAELDLWAELAGECHHLGRDVDTDDVCATHGAGGGDVARPGPNVEDPHVTVDCRGVKEPLNRSRGEASGKMVVPTWPLFPARRLERVEAVRIYCHVARLYVRPHVVHAVGKAASPASVIAPYFRHLRAGSIAASSRGAYSITMERRTAPGFVGRRAELTRLEDAVASASAGQGAIALVAGEAGIGKTRLVGELCDRAGQSGSTVLIGRCIDVVGSGLPFLPLVEAIRSLHDAPALQELTADLRELPRLVPELGDVSALTPDAPGATQLRLFQETVELLDRVSDDRPVVLVLEDLHWADASTLGLLSYLAYAVRDRRILVVATYRTSPPGVDLPRLVVELVRAGTATLLELAPLGERELTQLLNETSGESLEPPLAASICARSEGNPFFAEELLAAARDGDESVPPVLRDVLLERFDLLGGEARAVLRVAAASSRDIPYQLLAAIVPYDGPDLVRVLREAVEGGLLVADARAGTFRFRHALLAETVYETVLPGEREEIHARLARALVDDPAAAASTISGELAHHWAAAGRNAEALRASVAAARAAEAVAGRAEALRHLERVLELWPHVDGAETLVDLDLGEVLQWAAEVAYFAGVGARAPELIRQALTLPGAGDNPVRLGLLHERLATYLFPIGERAAAMAASAHAVELVPPEPPTAERAMVLSAYGHALMLAWRFDESKATCEEAIEVAAAIDDQRPALRAKAVLGVALFQLGAWSDGLECLRNAREMARKYGLVRDELRTYVLLSDVFLMRGDLDAAVADALEGLAKAGRHGYQRSSGMVMGANAAEALLGLGEWSQADEVLQNTLRDTGGFRPEGVHIVCAQLALGRGQLELAREHLEIGAHAREEPQSKAAYAALEAELALCERRHDDVLMVIDGALLSEEPGDLHIREPRLCTLGLRALVECVRLAAVGRDAAAGDGARRRGHVLLERARRSASRAAAVSPEAGGWAVVAEAEHTRMEGSSSAERWRDAIAIWERLGRPYPAAYCRLRLAEALLAAGASRIDAAKPARAAHQVAARLAATPLLQELERLAQRARLDLAGLETGSLPDDGDALGLTVREREVLQLLARGYTNREIAGELTISVKTASVHVSHILRKLDVTNRIEAAEIAHRLTPGSRRS